MKPFTFIHAADLHIDSPFVGLHTESEDVGRALRLATRNAFKNLVQACLDHEVDFLLVAGDVYDGKDRSVGAQLQFLEGLKRLAEADIRCFVVHGNHDPLDGRLSALAWPDEVHLFGPKPETIEVPVGGEAVATVTGVSFPRSDVRTNLAKKLHPPPGDLFHIGLLHCNVGADTGHESYAPCELRDLQDSGMNYWALGHVHERKILARDPHVVYPGNPQGRSIREPGTRGCYLVKVDGGGEIDLEFLPLNVVRWARGEISIGDLDTLDQLETVLEEAADLLAAEEEDRGLVCRLGLVGRGALHQELASPGALEDLLDRLRERFEARDPVLWVQQIDSETRPDIDLEALAGGEDLLAEVFAVTREFRESGGDVSDLCAVLADCFDNSRVKKAVDAPGDEEFRELLAAAEMLCVDLLTAQGEKL